VARPKGKALTEEALPEWAREQGVSLLGPGALLARLTKNVLETALEAEMTETSATRCTGRPRTGNVRKGPGPSPCSLRSAPLQIDLPETARAVSSRRS
jgi:putative transposase